MNDDIVARLRVWSSWLDERIPDTEIGNDLREAADEIERLRAERDEARRDLEKERYIAEYYLELMRSLAGDIKRLRRIIASYTGNGRLETQDATEAL